MSKIDILLELLSFVVGVLLLFFILSAPTKQDRSPCLLCDPCKCKPGRQCGCLEIPEEPDDTMQVKYVPPACECCQPCTCKIGSHCGCLEYATD